MVFLLGIRLILEPKENLEFFYLFFFVLGGGS